MARPLVAFFPLDVAELPPGPKGARVELTRKLIDGVKETQRHWGGEIVGVLAPRTRPDTNLDQQAYAVADLPFRLAVRAPGASIDDLLREAGLVLLAPFQDRIAAACRRLATPYCVVAEYNLATRLAIASEERRIHKRAKRMINELVRETVEQRVVARAAGLQCNGTPTFEAWAPLNRSPLLFFDSRVTPAMLASPEQAASRGRGDVLHLAFSGRFVAMKGVLHLPEIAARLRARGVRFEMHIYGGGPQEAQLRERIAALGLANVHIAGYVPFDELMARIKAIDLFVCPHVQGDPSCTYLETLACGVPIAGFANDAWRGMLQHVDAGWSARIGDHDGLAAAIEGAARDQRALAAAATRGLAFASDNTFDLTFARRDAHMKSIAR